MIKDKLFSLDMRITYPTFQFSKLCQNFEVIEAKLSEVGPGLQNRKIAFIYRDLVFYICNLIKWLLQTRIVINEFDMHWLCCNSLWIETKEGKNKGKSILSAILRRLHSRMVGLNQFVFAWYWDCSVLFSMGVTIPRSQFRKPFLNCFSFFLSCLLLKIGIFLFGYLFRNTGRSYLSG